MFESSIAMQVLKSDPTDLELVAFLDPDGRSVSLRIEETPEHVTAWPSGYPLWVTAVSVLIPLGGLFTFLGYEASRDGLSAFDITGALFGCVAILIFVAFFRLLNQRMTARGPYFVLDAVRRSLDVSR